MLKPFGIVWTLASVSTAFGVSSTERRVWIVSTMRDLFDLLLMKVGPLVMQNLFNILTGGPG